MISFDVNRLLEIGMALSTEKDTRKLLTIILDEAMNITSCDAGTLYTCDGNSLSFTIMVTKSLGYRQVSENGQSLLPPVPIGKLEDCHNVSARCALTGQLFNIPDVYSAQRFDFSGTKKYDEMTGYRTRSILVIPMEDNYGKIIGVLQLINATENGEVVPFDPEYEPVISSLASQAAISLTNMNYATDIAELFDSFVRVMSTAIDSRTPYNANHTRNMAKYGSNFCDWAAKQGLWDYSESKKRQFIMSIWLHDVGKLTTPLEIMDKETKLGQGLGKVLFRFNEISLLSKIALLEGRMSKDEYEKTLSDISEAQELVLQSNAGARLPDEALETINALGQRTYEKDGEALPWITQDELEHLRIRHGTLTAGERKIMESHVEMTEKLLSQLKFTPEYAMVPVWTSRHHEALDGSGYPRGLKGEELSNEVRLLTILDIFDALTARDRPYKPPMPVDKALSVLHDMADKGKLDKDILRLFEESRSWEETQ